MDWSFPTLPFVMFECFTQTHHCYGWRRQVSAGNAIHRSITALFISFNSANQMLLLEWKYFPVLENKQLTEYLSALLLFSRLTQSNVYWIQFIFSFLLIIPFLPLLQLHCLTRLLIFIIYCCYCTLDSILADSIIIIFQFNTEKWNESFISRGPKRAWLQMAETSVHFGPFCKPQQLHLPNFGGTAQNIFHSGKWACKWFSTQYVLLVLVKRNDIPSQAQEPQCLLNPYVILSFVGKQTSTVLGVCPCEAVCSVLQRCGSAIPCHELPWDLALRDCAISTSTAPTRPGCFKSLTFLLELQLFTSSASSLSLTSQRFSR